MKHKKKKTSLIHSCKISSICLLLLVCSMFSIGFATWYETGLNVKLDDVNVIVGEVIINDIGLKEFGFDVVSGSATSITTSKRLNIDDESVTNTYLNSNCLSVEATVDTNIMGTAYYYDDLYLSITFTYESYTSTTNNIIESLSIYPENYVGYSFNGVKSSKTTQKKNGKSTVFYFPMKTKNDISLSSVALLDTTYPKTNIHSSTGFDYKVPIVFEFTIDNDTLNSDLVNSSTKYSVTFSLVEGTVN